MHRRSNISELPEISELPLSLPQKGNVVSKAVGRCLLRLIGWKIVGRMPKSPKVIIAAAPHTSNWDFIIAMFAVLALGLRASYLMKREAFVWPFSGLFKWLGGVPVERKAAGGMVDGLVDWFANHEKAWLLVTPEGTRQKVSKYKRKQTDYYK